MRTARQAANWTIYCVACGKPIEAGQRYHYANAHGRKVFHTDCYEREVRNHGTAGE